MTKLKPLTQFSMWIIERGKTTQYDPFRLRHGHVMKFRRKAILVREAYYNNSSPGQDFAESDISMTSFFQDPPPISYNTIRRASLRRYFYQL